MTTFLKTATFRANSGYEIVPYNHLTAADQQVLSAGQDQYSYGVLRSKPGRDLPAVAVCRETALLFLTLREPGILPGYVDAVFGIEGERGLMRLVLDGILEVDGPNGYVSGPQACQYLGLNTPLGSGRLAQLSQAALQYAQALNLSDASALSLRLYLYNQTPASMEWRRRLPDGVAAAAFLGITPGGPHYAALIRAWRPLKEDCSWRFFAARAPRSNPMRSPCKLYISPSPEALPEALGVVIDVLGASEASHFKIGADLFGLLRPDKLVVYFPDKEGLLAAIDALRRRLDGMPPQGVPFTAEAGTALLSWGADPQHISASDAYSWRQWITNRLAASLIAAQDVHTGLEPWRFALERLKLDGVDPQTFSPTAGWTQAPTL